MNISLEVSPGELKLVPKCSSLEELSELYEEPFCFYLDKIVKNDEGNYEPQFSETDINNLWKELHFM